MYRVIGLLGYTVCCTDEPVQVMAAIKGQMVISTKLEKSVASRLPQLAVGRTLLVDYGGLLVTVTREATNPDSD